MARINYYNNRFFWLGSFEERILARDAGFKFDSMLSAWVTPNAYHAWRVRDKTRIVFSETAWEKLYSLDRQLNMSRLLRGEVLTKATYLPKRTQQTTSAKNGSELFPFQRIPVEYIQNYNRRHPLLICDDPGTGKTCQALSVINYDRAKSILVICPANKREDWARDIENWCDMPEAKLGFTEAPTSYRPPRVFVTSWSLLADEKYQDWLLKQDFQNVIADEIHYAKTITASRTKGLFRLGRRFRRLIGLSGTFPPNFPSELWPFIRFSLNYMNVFPYPSFGKFINHFCILGSHENKVFVIGSQNTEELQFHLRANIMVRRTLDDVFPELPPAILRFRTIESNDILDHLHAQERELAKAFLTEDYSVARVPIGKLAELRKKIAILKANFILDYARRILEKERKLVILGHHQELLTELASNLNSEFGAVLIFGKTPSKKKHEYKERFQGDEDIRVCVGNIKACGEAIELTAAAYGIFAEASWVPGENEQGIGRLRRYGQVRKVFWDFLIVRNSLDERVLRRALRKAADLKQVRDTRLEGELKWLDRN